MKNKLTLAMLFTGLAAFSQVKVGDNSTIVNTSSLLELESTNKGLLLPRVALTSTAVVAPLGAHVQGMHVYNTATGTIPNNEVTPGEYYNDGTKWVRMVANGDANLGINTATPQKNLHVNGSLQVTGELNVGGNATSAGGAGTPGQILVSKGASEAPQWKSASVIPGTISAAVYIDGNAAASTTSAGATAPAIDVPGVTYIHIVPAGITQTLLFTVTGYARSGGNYATQGVFSLLQDSTKLCSAYAYTAGNTAPGGSLGNLPASTTLLKSVTLTPGTYSFKVQYKAWSGAIQTVNFNPYPTYIGSDTADKEAMLTKMQVLIYNN